MLNPAIFYILFFKKTHNPDNIKRGVLVLFFAISNESFFKLENAESQSEALIDTSCYEYNKAVIAPMDLPQIPISPTVGRVRRY